MPVRKHGTVVWPAYGRTPYRPLRSRLAKELGDCAVGRSTVLASVRNEHPGDFELLKGSLADVAADLQRQVTAMLDPQYREAIFWFCPHNLERIQIINNWDLSEKTVKRLAAEEAWLARTRPGLGQERPVRMVATAEHRITGGEAKYIPDDKQWPDLGCWQLTAFPQAVAWLTGWVRDAHRDIAALQAEFDTKRAALQERITTLQHTHLKQVHHKEYLGDIPAKHFTFGYTPDRRFIRHMGWVDVGKGWATAAQWYDPVEELDQTHADRRLELANQLAHLPPLTVYCRTPTGQHQVALPRTREAAFDEARINAIRQEAAPGSVDRRSHPHRLHPPLGAARRHRSADIMPTSQSRDG